MRYQKKNTQNNLKFFNEAIKYSFPQSFQVDESPYS